MRKVDPHRQRSGSRLQLISERNRMPFGARAGIVDVFKALAQRSEIGFVEVGKVLKNAFETHGLGVDAGAHVLGVRRFLWLRLFDFFALHGVASNHQDDPRGKFTETAL